MARKSRAIVGEGDWAVQVRNRGYWILVNHRFKDKNAALNWGGWNYSRGGVWQAIKVADFVIQP